MDKKLVGAIMVVGLSVIASHFLLRNQINKGIEYQQFGSQSTANGPATITSAGFVTPVATHAAPRMYVKSGAGADGPGNPGESWLQGGGSSVTNSTGRWAA